MALPANLTTIEVTGRFIDMVGNPIAGQVKFTPRAVLKNVGQNVILINSTITVTLDSSGEFAQDLVATDDADATPLGFTYRVEEAFIGGRTYDILLPSNTIGGTIDLADIVPAVENDGSGALYAAYDDYVDLEARVTVVEELALDAEAFFSDLADELDAAIAGSNTHVALMASYVTMVGQITNNGGGVTPLLFPAKAS
jgi:hypothetical protein